MRIVIALGGNALLRRSDPMTTEVQRRNVAVAAQAIAPLAKEHSIVVVHGNGPQVGLLSLQSEAYTGAEPYPLDVLDAGTQGMIGYLIQQELRPLLPPEHQVATLLTMITVDHDDPAFANPTKFVGPVYDKPGADALAGVEAVIDKDLAAELLAENVNADLFVMATDEDGVYVDWGTPQQRRLGQVTPEELATHNFPAGSMGPKVQGATRFATNTGNRGAIGALADIAAIVAGEAGTSVVTRTAVRA